MYKNATSLYNKLLAIYFKEYTSIADEEKEDMDKKYDPKNLFIKGIKFDKWYKIYKEEMKSQPKETIAERVKINDEDLSNMPPLERDEKEVKFDPEETIAE